MSLSPLVSFKSRFVTYLLNFPRTCRKYFSRIIDLKNIFCRVCIRILSILTVHFHCQYKYRLSAYSCRQVSPQVLFHVPTRSNILLGKFCMKHILTKGMYTPFNRPSFCLFDSISLLIRGKIKITFLII